MNKKLLLWIKNLKYNCLYCYQNVTECERVVCVDWFWLYKTAIKDCQSSFVSQPFNIVILVSFYKLLAVVVKKNQQK